MITQEQLQIRLKELETKESNSEFEFGQISLLKSLLESIKSLNKNIEVWSPEKIKLGNKLSKLTRLIRRIEKLLPDLVKNVEGGSGWIYEMFWSETLKPHISYGVKIPDSCYRREPDFPSDIWIRVEINFNRWLKFNQEISKILKQIDELPNNQ
jgi:hypothetical protein